MDPYTHHQDVLTRNRLAQEQRILLDHHNIDEHLRIPTTLKPVVDPLIQIREDIAWCKEQMTLLLNMVTEPTKPTPEINRRKKR